MLLLMAVVADRVRIFVPTAILSFSMIPYATISLVIGGLSWVLPQKWIINADNFLYTIYLRTTLFVFENISAVKISLYGDIETLKVKKESALVISNHQSNVDWAAVNMLAARQSPNGIEYGLRFVVKDAIHYVPLFGWYIYQHGYLYVRRFGSFAPKPVLRQLKQVIFFLSFLVDYLYVLKYLFSLKEKFWIHLFPEGTRFSLKKPEHIETSRKFCEKNNHKLLKHLLAPRAMAFSLITENLRDSLDCIYDITLAYSLTGSTNKSLTRGNAPNMFEFCGSSTPYELHMHLQRIPIREIPQETAAQKEWLIKQFEHKDNLLNTFYSEGQFPNLVEANTPKLVLYRNLVPFLCFTSAITVLPVVFPKIRFAYLLTFGTSPFLIAWLHFQKCV